MQMFLLVLGVAHHRWQDQGHNDQGQDLLPRPKTCPPRMMPDM